MKKERDMKFQLLIVKTMIFLKTEKECGLFVLKIKKT